MSATNLVTPAMLQALKKKMLEEEYSIGSILFRSDGVDPAETHGGTWVKIASKPIFDGEMIISEEPPWFIPGSGFSFFDEKMTIFKNMSGMRFFYFDLRVKGQQSVAIQSGSTIGTHTLSLDAVYRVSCSIDIEGGRVGAGLDFNPDGSVKIYLRLIPSDGQIMKCTGLYSAFGVFIPNELSYPSYTGITENIWKRVA